MGGNRQRLRIAICSESIALLFVLWLEEEEGEVEPTSATPSVLFQVGALEVRVLLPLSASGLWVMVPFLALL